MDGESNYESDISESWSLIDINLNEESPSVSETSELPLSELINENLGKKIELEVEDFIKKCEEASKTEFSRVSDSELKKEERFSRTDVNCQKSFSDDDAKNDSGDNESIEIIELDGNYQDLEVDRFDISSIDQLDISTYQSDDEESLEEKSSGESRSNNSTVIRRKKLKTPHESTVHSVNSENKSKEEDIKELNEEPSRAHSSPVYKHYRNNVVNTVLSLSVGVIFAGVACLAIGHFLGVQEASETAVELAETLKKLQAENAALHSALLTLEMNSKLDLPLDQQEDAPREVVEPSETPVADLNNAALSAVRSSVNSIEWLSKLQSLIRKNKMNEKENGANFNGLGKYIVDQVHSLNRRMEDGAKFFEDADKKISKYLKKIMKRLSSSQDNIEVLHERLIKLKDMLNNKLNKAPNSADETGSRKTAPLTELGGGTQWQTESRIDKSGQPDHRKPALYYNFPQPEKYYQSELTGKKFEVTNSNQTARSEKRDSGERETKEKAKKGGKKSRRKWKEKKKGAHKRNGAVNVVLDLDESREKGKTRYVFSRSSFNVTNPQSKKYSKPREKNAKHKRKFKKDKHSKLKKVLLSNLKKVSFLKKKQSSRLCSRPRCLNVTGHWVFRWAGGAGGIPAATGCRGVAVRQGEVEEGVEGLQLR